ncbi:hypothetical protein BD414DRAFT_128548 [Trametes punicea]|nr:hypothetical protein BD414DRAFT_128548 [Trametes punicea]
MPLTYRGYAVYISCDGRELGMYGVKVENDEVISCYIAADAGKQFRVHWVDSKPPTHLSVEVRTDGHRIGVVSYKKGSLKVSELGIPVALDARDVSETSRGDLLPSAYSGELRIIEVRLRRVRDFIAVPSISKLSSAANRSRNLHSGSERTSMAVPVRGNRREAQSKATILRPILIDDKPFVIFRFKYRPRSMAYPGSLNGITHFPNRLPGNPRDHPA